MTEELKKCLTVLFRHKGKEILTEKEFVYAASMDLHWFSPKDAQKLLEVSVKSGLLKMTKGMLSPTFELAEKHMEFDFKPCADVLKCQVTEEKSDPFVDLVGKISSCAKISKKDVFVQINKMQSQLKIEIEVAALMVARAHEIDVEKEIQKIEVLIQSR